MNMSIEEYGKKRPSITKTLSLYPGDGLVDLYKKALSETESEAHLLFTDDIRAEIVRRMDGYETMISAARKAGA